MKGLTGLDLRSNALTRLPMELGQLQRLKFLYLDANPLQSPSHEIIRQGAEAILRFIRNASSGKTEPV